MSKNKFEKGLQKYCEEVEKMVYDNNTAFFDCIEEANARGVEAEVVLAERARAKAAALYAEIDDNMNPKKWD